MEARRAQLDAACNTLLKRLTGPGDFLTGARRAAIVREASCAAECQAACAKIRQEGRGPGLMRRAESEWPDDIGCLVQCVASLQELLDEEWYDLAKHKLAARLASLGEFDGGDDERVACLTELVMVVAGTVGVRKFYAGTGLPMPTLPAATQGAPLYKSVSEFCSGSLERTKFAWGRQVTKAKIVPAGLEKAGVSPSKWVLNTVPMRPFSKMTPCPLSLSFHAEWGGEMYLPDEIVLKWSAPAPPGRCLRRYDMEVVASTYAGAVQCDF